MLESTITPRGLGIEIEAVLGYLGMGGNSEVQQSLADIAPPLAAEEVGEPSSVGDSLEALKD